MIYVNFGTGNSTSMLANASTTMHDIAHSVMLSASPNAIFAPTGNALAGITSGYDGESRLVGGGTATYDPVTNTWTGSVTVAPATITSVTGVISFNNSISLRPLTPQSIQQNTPVPFQPLTGSNFKDFEAAYRLVLRLLKSAKCRKIITGDSSDPRLPLKAMYKLTSMGASLSFGYGGPNNNGVAETEAIKTPAGDFIATGRVALYDLFFTGDVGGIASAHNLSTVKARAVTILHELRHLLKGEWHGVNGGAFGSTFDDEIVANCFD
jgi:hypothetical protein